MALLEAIGYLALIEHFGLETLTPEVSSYFVAATAGEIHSAIPDVAVAISRHNTAGNAEVAA
jgi:hypothetical protein